MATASTIHLDVSRRPVFAVQHCKPESAAMASRLLQRNHDDFHIFFNDAGLHNHICHHLSTIFALGATPDTLKKQWDHNLHYQMARKPLKKSVVEDLHDPKLFSQYLGQGKRYPDYLAYFEREIDEKGWQNVLNEYVFGGNARADDMLGRLFDGALHPLIHLGFGVEFEQPAIVAEALAETAVHSSELANSFLFPAEQTGHRKVDDGDDSPSLMQLLGEVRRSGTLKNCIRAEDKAKMRDGVLGRAGSEMVGIAGKFTVKANQGEIREALQQMIEVCAYYTMASQRSSKAIKVDFFYLHALNASLFFVRFMSASWLSEEHKARLLEFKGRYDLAMYVSRGCPDLWVEEIKGYSPVMLQDRANNIETEEQWERLFRMASEMLDDGHVSKLVRACKVGEELWNSGTNVSKKAEEAGEIITSDMWLMMAHMVIDSTYEQEVKWVMNTGLDGAWKNIQARREQKRLSATL